MGGVSRRWARSCGIVIGATVALLCAPAQAQDSAGSSLASLTLGEAIGFAGSHYPAVEAAAFDRRAAEARIAEARAAYFPQVNLIAQINRATFNNITGVLLPQSVIPSISGPPFASTSATGWNSGVGVLAVWRPFDFGERGARVEAAREAAAGTRYTEAATRLEIELATAKAYLNVVAAQSLRQTAQANVERLRAFAVSARALVDNKLRAGVELGQAEAAVAMAQVGLSSADRNLEAQRATLERLIGRPLPAGLLSIPAGRPVVLTAGVGDEHPLAKRQQARVDERAADLRAVSRSYAPEVSIVGSASARGSGRANNGAFLGGSEGLTPDVGNWALGVQLSFPIGSYPAVRARQQAQRASLEAERRRYSETLANLEERRRQARAEVDAAEAILGIVPASLAAARAVEEQQRARFRSGLVSAVEVTAATAALAQAESENAIAAVNLWRAAAELDAAQGDLAGYQQQAAGR
jgi:outer membrane protein